MPKKSERKTLGNSRVRRVRAISTPHKAKLSELTPELFEKVKDWVTAHKQACAANGIPPDPDGILYPQAMTVILLEANEPEQGKRDPIDPSSRNYKDRYRER
ncbi:MAG TPA: hypothetical protein VEA59_04060 [Patescibacteria group bacterium]|nr:hypothetical protein [Patescibacteria group bacterium]